MIATYIKNIFTTTYKNAQLEISENEKNGKHTFITCVTVALCLTCINYFGSSENAHTIATLLGFEKLFNHSSYNNTRLYELLWWASVLFVFYFVLPALVIKTIFREKIADYGLKLKGAFSEKKLYFLMLLIMVPVVLSISFSSSFQSKYPFYKPTAQESLLGNFLIWQIAYLLQFFALEFFFRGFMVHATKKTFGFYSVLVMTIPYCMIHFGKPMPETIAAIIAGIVLGTLSLKSKSIWLGVAIHYSVAITMDLAALWHKGLLF